MWHRFILQRPKQFLIPAITENVMSSYSVLCYSNLWVYTEIFIYLEIICYDIYHIVLRSPTAFVFLYANVIVHHQMHDHSPINGILLRKARKSKTSLESHDTLKQYYTLCFRIIFISHICFLRKQNSDEKLISAVVIWHHYSQHTL